ncbi:MAG: YkgJ family cysteine cluster protein [Thermoplasmata archaeon]
MDDLREVPELNVDLLAGFGFACRPDCGLCCYAEPRLLPGERTRLLQIAPEVEIVERDGDTFIAAHPDGGACQFLSDNRCRAHAARPHPCREFPLTAHVGTRLQATVVLSCPGVELNTLEAWPQVGSPDSVTGFSAELDALTSRVDHSAVRRLESSARRRRKVVRALQSDDRWQEEEEVRARLRRQVPLPTTDNFPVADPPSADDGVENLPLFFDRRAAPVALAEGLGGWELLELRPGGGVARSLGVLPPPDRPPEIEAAAARLMRGYLRYWLERDAMFGAVHLRMLDSTEGTVTDWVEEELRAIGALVLARAEVRAKVRRGVVDRLTRAELLDGIRASDQDLLDRASWGDRF